jgi:hypothetical protein
MTGLHPAFETRGIVLPEPDARRLLEAIDAPEGWSGAAGLYTHANGLVLQAAFHRHSQGVLVLTLPRPLMRLRAAEAFPDLFPDHPGIVDPDAVGQAVEGWTVGFLRAPRPGILPEGTAFGAALDAACGPRTRSLVRALARVMARRFGGPAQWAATDDPETGGDMETIMVTVGRTAREIRLVGPDALLPLLSALDVRAFQRRGLHLVERLAWAAPDPSAHQRLADQDALAPWRSHPAAPRWLAAAS